MEPQVTGAVFITEAERQTPVLDSADVVVAGGGIAGCAAALAAARNAADVLLIEKQTMLGGLATAGLITYYLPLCDGEGRQMSYGIAEEFLRLSVQQYPEKDIPECWKKTSDAGAADADTLRILRTKERYETRFSPGVMAMLLEEKLRGAGVRILYDTRICGVVKTEKGTGVHVEGILVENESGRGAVAARGFVDATGGASLFRFAGSPVREHGQGNILASWYYYLKDGKHTLREMGAAPSIAEDFAEISGQDEAAYEAAMTRKPGGLRWYAGTNGGSVSDFIADTHEMILADCRAKDWEPTILPTMPQLRMTRCLAGAYELKETENDVSFADSIGMCGDWRKRGMRYEIPYRSLYINEIENVWAAGRCISADDGMWDISRVIPPCAVTGEAAGTAAALIAGAAKSDCAGRKNSVPTAASLAYEQLATVLRKGGQRLNFAETTG